MSNEQATGNIRVYTDHIFDPSSEPSIKLIGVVEFDPPIPESDLKNRYLAWLLLDPVHRNFVRYSPDEEGHVSVVVHKLDTPRNNFRSRVDLIDYYSERNNGERLIENDHQ